jgi:hypothetical protein
MVRSMASDVSTLSGCVAKGHQTVHLVSSTPSKIPYGRFSPVRLQTSLRHSHLRRPLDLLIGCHCLGWSAFGVTPHPSGTKASDPYCWSSGPWLPDRLYCPARSSLTMATSAPLPTAFRLMDYSVRLRACARQPQRVPNLLCQSF